MRKVKYQGQVQLRKVQPQTVLEGGKPEDSTPSTPRASGDTETGGSAKWWDIVVKYIVPIVAAMYVSMVTLFEGKGRVLGHVW